MLRVLLMTPITGPHDAHRAVRAALPTTEQECFLVLLLDARGRLIGGSPILIAMGSAASVAVHPRDVFRAAVRQNASAIILSHNHPSGDPSPSREDIALTDQLMNCASLLGIPIRDHVIVAGDTFTSLAELGHMDSAPGLRVAADR